MANFLASLLCCFPSSDSDHNQASSSKASNTTRTRPTGNSATESATNSGRNAMSSEVNPTSAVKSDMHDAASVPLEYVKPAQRLPEEIAIEGNPAPPSTPGDPSASTATGIDYSPSVTGGSVADFLTGAPSISGVSAGESSPKGASSSVAASDMQIEDADETDIPAVPFDDNPDWMKPRSMLSQDRLPEWLCAYPEGDLLPPPSPDVAGRKVLVLDLDETLVHSSFKQLCNADFVIPVKIEDTVHEVNVVKRPGVDEFLKRVSELYEVVVFTASVSKYGDPLLDRLDPHEYVHHRLFRESCYNMNGSYVKNLVWLGRPLSNVIIIDNSPAAYALQPYNAVPVSSWFSDVHDNELLDMLPILEDLASTSVTDVVPVLQYEWH